jgi:hypothetical protein
MELILLIRLRGELSGVPVIDENHASGSNLKKAVIHEC